MTYAHCAPNPWNIKFSKATCLYCYVLIFQKLKLVGFVSDFVPNFDNLGPKVSGTVSICRVCQPRVLHYAPFYLPTGNTWIIQCLFLPSHLRTLCLAPNTLPHPLHHLHAASLPPSSASLMNFTPHITMKIFECFPKNPMNQKALKESFSFRKPSLVNYGRFCVCK